MPSAPSTLSILPAPIPTWFGVGGHAERLAHAASADDVRQCLELDPRARILGDGANLLVDDDGVPELVIATAHMARVEFHAPDTCLAQAGADLPKLIHECVRRGLAGLEGLTGIPATVGGAVIMNAGGAFGQIADAVHRVHALSRDGRPRTIDRADIAFDYRHSGLAPLVVTAVEFRLSPGDPEALRAKVKDVMAYKKTSQPLAARSAGCCFKNPTLPHDLRDGAGDIGQAGRRVSAGLLIDRAGLKGLRLRGAEVSTRHANFLTPLPGGAARDVIDLMAEVERRVFDTFGVRLEREVVVWSRHA
ncbi:MAG: UDP-N-acetylmuramate dehydrogenase [Planctomycetota bacterium]|nr:UDP-N-acetylmuramate dehydrogenase [Planctomycetota bacterium]